MEDKKIKQRSNLQNNSIHKLYAEYCDLLNESGLTIPVVLENLVGIDWTPALVKEVWRSIQKSKVGKEHTKDLNTNEVDLVFEEFNRFFSGFGLHIPFPSIQAIIDKQRDLSPVDSAER